MYLYHNGIMDVSFEINNSEGDQIMVALSYYDSETVRIFTSDPLTLTNLTNALAHIAPARR